uniref:N-acetyltransferase domain-containing protein n=1 Tax=Globisporangium ultimum (strain ATCC 200006 / CBS 805.95 / DAOM BR144) TaxID=431595 RepID=K3W5T5_GLOUD
VEHVQPSQLAYDRPSPKLFAFLKKHADLEQFRDEETFTDWFEEGKALGLVWNTVKMAVSMPLEKFKKANDHTNEFLSSE